MVLTKKEAAFIHDKVFKLGMNRTLSTGITETMDKFKNLHMSYSYQDPSMPHDQATQLLSSRDPSAVTSALISIGLNEENWLWAQGVCIDHLQSQDKSIAFAAITAIGHIARRHKKLDLVLTTSALAETQSKHPSLAGSIADTLDDIEMFITDK
ncbi:hypothetical protein [Pseudomonas sp.]|uniref:hypothetical protein n=1 Tax=Pseudomonas sp. TaxID=306 RepID=UPI003D14C447